MDLKQFSEQCPAHRRALHYIEQDLQAVTKRKAPSLKEGETT